MDTFDNLLQGRSPAFLNLLRTARIAAKTDVSLLLSGENGTGKELLAQAIHQESTRHGHAFIAVNCLTFADMHEPLPVRIKAAEGGSLFLNEVDKLPFTMQTRLLHFLETGECHLPGKTGPAQVDTRILAASSTDLQQAVRNGDFNKKLFYRLNIVPLQVPALRERHGDIKLLINSLNQELARQHGLDAPHYSNETMKQLQQYDWPGNTRELRNFCERMLILLAGQTINITNLPQDIMTQSHPVTTDNGFTLPDGGIVLEELEADLIHQALDKCQGNQSKAARLLGLTRSALLYRMKKHAIA